MMQAPAASSGDGVTPSGGDAAARSNVDEPTVDREYAKPEDAGFELDEQVICRPCDDVVQDDEGAASVLINFP